MSFDALVRSALSMAHTLTESLQDTVSHEAYASQDGFGKPTFSSAVSRTAIVEKRTRKMVDATGREVLSTAKITFLQPVAIDQRDRLTLSDGTTGPILSIDGLMDPSTSKPFYRSIYLG